jgi:hypothetical protein
MKQKDIVIKLNETGSAGLAVPQLYPIAFGNCNSIAEGDIL